MKVTILEEVVEDRGLGGGEITHNFVVSEPAHCPCNQSIPTYPGNAVILSCDSLLATDRLRQNGAWWRFEQDGVNDGADRFV